MRIHEIKEAMKDYRSSWRGRVSQYDDDYYDTHAEKMHNDDKAIAWRHRLTPKTNITQIASDIIPKSDDVIHRGMSAREYNNITRHGVIKSHGSGNMGDEQMGLTYYTTDPDSAANYAGWYAQRGKKPTPDNPAYIVSIRRPSDGRIKRVDGTGDHEIGVMGEIPVEDIVAVYRGAVVDYTPADRDINTAGGRGAYDKQKYELGQTGGSAVDSLARIHWEKIQ